MRIIVRTAGGSLCEVLPGGGWTCRDLHMDVETKLGIPVSQQRLLHGSELLEEFMAASAVGTMGHLLQLSGEGTLELSLYIRSTAAIEALGSVERDGLALQHASEELKGDREVVMAALKQNGYALQHASEELKGDREVVMAAVKQNGYALRQACEELKGDREVIMAAVKQNGNALFYASEELKSDREVVMAALKQNGDALRQACEELKGDREVVMRL